MSVFVNLRDAQTAHRQRNVLPIYDIMLSHHSILNTDSHRQISPCFRTEIFPVGDKQASDLSTSLPRFLIKVSPIGCHVKVTHVRGMYISVLRRRHSFDNSVPEFVMLSCTQAVPINAKRCTCSRCITRCYTFFIWQGTTSIKAIRCVSRKPMPQNVRPSTKTHLNI